MMVVKQFFCCINMSFNSLFSIPSDEIISVRLSFGDLNSHLVEFSSLISMLNDDGTLKEDPQLIFFNLGLIRLNWNTIDSGRSVPNNLLTILRSRPGLNLMRAV